MKKRESFTDNALQKKQPLSLRKNFSWTFIANIIYGICQWGILVAIAKLGTPEMVGQFTLGLAVVTPVFLLTNLELRSVQATDANKEYNFSHYLLLRLITTTLGLLVAISLIMLIGYHEKAALVIMLIGIVKAIESFSDVYYGFLQQHEQMDNVAKSIIWRNLLSLITLISLFYFTHDIVWATVGLISAAIITFVSYDIPVRNLLLGISEPKSLKETYKQVREVVDKTLISSEFEIILKLAWLSLPAGLLVMLLSLNRYIPRYFIEWHLGQKELGIFAAIEYPAIVGITIVTALGQSALPRLGKYYVKGNQIEFKNLLLKLIGIGILLGFLGIIVVFFGGSQLLSILYKPEYAEYKNIFVLLMFWVAILYITSFLGYAATAARYFRSNLALSIVITMITTILSYFVIPSHALLGSAIVLVTTSLVQLFGNILIVLHLLDKLDKMQRL
jgi:O-antigen/teichoic acid export membrane protein